MLLTRLGMSAVAVAVMMLFLDAASADDIKIGNRSQFIQTGSSAGSKRGSTNSAGGATAVRAQSTSPSPKATTATRGRPQTLVFKPGRYIIKN